VLAWNVDVTEAAVHFLSIKASQLILRR